MRKTTKKSKEVKNVSTESRTTTKFETITPLNTEQEEYVSSIRKNMFTLVEGRAGTGKTLLAFVEAIKLVKARKYDKIMYLRCYMPSIATEKDMGSLPGEFDDKMSAFKLPVYDNLAHIMPKKDIDGLFNSGVIEVSNISFLRGRTFDRTIIIADEFQEACKNLTHLVMSRIGNHSKLIILSSLVQAHVRSKTEPFLYKLISILENYPKFSHITLTECVRNSFIDDILREIEEA